MKLIQKVVLIVSISTAVFAEAHGGRLDASGCHAGSQPYHCHRSANEMVESSSGGYRLKCNAGSKSKDCTNTSYKTNEKVKVNDVDIDLEELFTIAKFHGGCGIIGQMATFQESTKMAGGLEFLERFSKTEAARLGMSFNHYVDLCVKAASQYDSFTKILSDRKS